MLDFMMVASSLIMIFCGLWSFTAYHKHLLNSLLSLEFMMLGVFWLMSMQMAAVGVEGYFTLFFLTLAACEGALGLSLLVLMVRSHGNDRFMSFSLLEC
uniref:NADH-ubiquinone oxidoreductase chain 4L n=1 Tax=Metacarcinus magister TaxID=29965 RepID=A0A7G7WQE6_METMG|nr:NADH dehydrogenase subunit 4L [Metacarcinus magister]QNH68773.1 NADH dehydrogenase subunit 4L [Metacarcinus magister]